MVHLELEIAPVLPTTVVTSAKSVIRIIIEIVLVSAAYIATGKTRVLDLEGASIQANVYAIHFGFWQIAASLVVPMRSSTAMVNAYAMRLGQIFAEFATL
jgi:hypothetical protein